jgi:hypothetical protein
MTAIDTKVGRFYPFEGERYVSVTTILGDGVPKPAINNWKIKMMAELAAKNRLDLATKDETEAKEWLLAQTLYSGEAAILGSSLHAKFDKIAKGLSPTNTVAEAGYLDSFYAFIVAHQPVYIFTESTVFSKTYGYAGTLDFIAVLKDGRTVIGDYKTGKAVWPDAALQISAYRYADFIGTKDGATIPIPECNGAVVLHVRPNGFKLIDVDAGPRTFDTFLSALDMYRWLNIDSKGVLLNG